MSGERTVAEVRPKLVFAPEDDVPVRYMDRTREYYQALGFSPYRWAHYTDAPFTPPAQPRGPARGALITTAAQFQPEAGDQGPHAAYNAGAKFYEVYSAPVDRTPDLSTTNVSYDAPKTGADALE